MNKDKKDDMMGYSDSDWCGDRSVRRITYGYVFK